MIQFAMMYSSTVKIELDDYVDLSDAAKAEKIAIWRLKRACDSGRLPFVEFGTRYLVRRDVLRHYLKNRTPGRPSKTE